MGIAIDHGRDNSPTSPAHNPYLIRDGCSSYIFQIDISFPCKKTTLPPLKNFPPTSQAPTPLPPLIPYQSSLSSQNCGRFRSKSRFDLRRRTTNLSGRINWDVRLTQSLLYGPMAACDATAPNETTDPNRGSCLETDLPGA